MAGLGSQGRAKAARRVADMSMTPDDAPTPRWSPPPPDECNELDSYSFISGEEKFIVRQRQHLQTEQLVEFAIVHMTFERAKWRYVAMADSCHDVDVHLHFYSRRRDERTGEPVQLLEITEASHLVDGYHLSYEVIVGDWEKNKRRWRDV